MATEVTSSGSGLPPARAAHSSASDWFGQPRGLTVLFLTDMWEQFSFFGMRSLLVFYMVKQLLLAQEKASLIYGIYAAFVYFTPIVGGVVSDRWLGKRNSVVIGGSIMALGHFMMAFEPLFYVALATIALGNGLFLPSLPSQIGTLYSEDDPRRRSAYNFYYMGVNIGGFLAPLGCGTVGELYGWHWGFTVAGVGMITGLVIYLLGGRYLPRETSMRERRTAGRPVAARGAQGIWPRFALLAGIAGTAVVFRGAYEQVGNTLPLWIEHTHRTVGSFVIPMTWFQSINPLVVILLTPWLVAYWLRLARDGREPSSIVKMAIGAGVVAFSYVMLAGVAAWSDHTGTPATWLWLVAFFIVMTTGELYILPIGLGLFGRLAPEGFGATSIALWFFAAFAGNLAAGAAGATWSRLSAPQFFILIAVIAGVSGLLLLFFDRSVRKLADE
jgi:proton-dependent oligopeptide transporter, POT family